MALIVVKDRVRETTTTTGTGTITLGGAVSGFQSFAAIGNGNQTYYCIASSDTGAWEVGYGTYTSSGTTLTRNDPPLASSNAGALVDFSAGTKDVFCTYPAEKATYEEISGETVINGGPLTVLGAGVTVNPALEAELGKFVGNVDSFGQVYAINQNDGSSASADFVVYNDLTTDGYTNFTDMGINSSNYSSTTYPIFTPGSGYVYHDGDDFFVGNQTPGKDLVIFAGGADTTNEVLRLSGTDQTATFASDINVGGGLDVTNAATFGSTVTLSANPTAALQAATKQYVDNATSTGIHIHTSVTAETSAALSAVYTQGGTTFNITDITGGNTVTTSTTHGLSVNDQIWLYTSAGNGLSTNTAYFVYSVPASNQLTLSTSYAGTQLTGLTNASGLTYATRANSGVGAYLEASANEVLPISGVTTSDRVLVYNQSTGYWNGVYTVTSLGSVGSKWKLTRATDADYYSPSNVDGLSEGDYFFVQSNSESYVLTTPGSIIIGYTGITYTLFSASPTYTGTAPINVSGTTIALTGTVAATNGGTGTSTVTTGDLLYGSATNTWSKLAAGSAYKSLVMNAGGTQVEWNAVALNQSGAVSGALGATNGGTGQSTYALGDMIYASAANTLAKLSGNSSTTKKFMSQTGTGAGSASPVWDTISGSDVTGNISGQAGSVANALTAGTYMSATGTFDGSVARTFSVDATALNTASKVVARDGSGDFAAGIITATLSGTATSVAGGAANKVLYQTGSGTTGFVDAPVTANTALTWNGSAFTWAAAGGSSFASGTAMLFVQTAAPTGWTKDTTTHNNKALRVVTGTASSGGSVAFTTAFASQTPAGTVSVSGTVGSTTLGTGEMPSHTHTSNYWNHNNSALNGAGNNYAASTNATAKTFVGQTTTGAGSSGSHSHSFSGSGSFTGTAINLAVQYVDVIIATKD